jgi:hypothetical protein
MNIYYSNWQIKNILEFKKNCTAKASSNGKHHLHKQTITQTLLVLLQDKLFFGGFTKQAIFIRKINSKNRLIDK